MFGEPTAFHQGKHFQWATAGLIHDLVADPFGDKRITDPMRAFPLM